MKRLVVLNLTMLAVIVALVAYYVAESRNPGELEPGSIAGHEPGGGAGDALQGNDGGAAADPGNREGDDGAVADGRQDGDGGHGADDEGGGANGAGATNDGKANDDGAAGDGDAGNAVAADDRDAVSGDRPDNGGSGGGDAPSAGAGVQGEGGGDAQVRLAFVGDVLLSGSVQPLMEKHGYDYPYRPSLAFLTEPDLTAANLETPVTERGIPAEDKQFVFKASPKSLPALKEAGFDVVSLANNHTLDQGTEGLLDTIGYLDDAGIPNMGAGHDDAEAFTPVYLEANGMTVAYVGLTRVVPEVSWKAGSNHPGLAETYDPARAEKAIAAAAKKADIVVVMVHWGIEREDFPNSDQKSLAHRYIDAGADLVIGSHPHVLQGFEIYKGKWIAYSLGNYIFNTTKTEKSQDTGVLDAVCTAGGECRLQLHPMRLVDWQPTPLDGEKGAALLRRVSGISLNAAVDESGYVKER